MTSVSRRFARTDQPIPLTEPTGTLIDDAQAQMSGMWQNSRHSPHFFGTGYLHDDGKDKGAKTLSFTPHLPASACVARCANRPRWFRAGSSASSVDGKVHLHDLHATILHQLGLDHERLTFRHAGRDYRPTDVYGEVVKELLA
jgi:hypothetical protein